MYVFQEFPKWKYHPTKEACVVGSKEAEEALGPGWFNSPAGFCKPECEATHADALPPIELPKKSKKAKA